MHPHLVHEVWRKAPLEKTLFVNAWAIPPQSCNRNHRNQRKGTNISPKINNMTKIQQHGATDSSEVGRNQPKKKKFSISTTLFLWGICTTTASTTESPIISWHLVIQVNLYFVPFIIFLGFTFRAHMAHLFTNNVYSIEEQEFLHTSCVYCGCHAGSEDGKQPCPFSPPLSMQGKLFGHFLCFSHTLPSICCFVLFCLIVCQLKRALGNPRTPTTDPLPSSLWALWTWMATPAAQVRYALPGRMNLEKTRNQQLGMRRLLRMKSSDEMCCKWLVFK